MQKNLLVFDAYPIILKLLSESDLYYRLLEHVNFHNQACANMSEYFKSAFKKYIDSEIDFNFSIPKVEFNNQLNNKSTKNKFVLNYFLSKVKKKEKELLKSGEDTQDFLNSIVNNGTDIYNFKKGLLYALEKLPEPTPEQITAVFKLYPTKTLKILKKKDMNYQDILDNELLHNGVLVDPLLIDQLDPHLITESMIKSISAFPEISFDYKKIAKFKNKYLIEQIFKCNPEIIKYLNPKLISEAQVKTFIENNPEKYEFLPKETQNQPNILNLLIKNKPENIIFADLELKQARKHHKETYIREFRNHFDKVSPEKILSFGLQTCKEIFFDLSNNEIEKYINHYLINKSDFFHDKIMNDKKEAAFMNCLFFFNINEDNLTKIVTLMSLYQYVFNYRLHDCKIKKPENVMQILNLENKEKYLRFIDPKAIELNL